MNAEAVIHAYLECALWAEAETDEETDECWSYDDRYTIDDIAPESVAQAGRDCIAFLESTWDDIADCAPAEVGCDLWLTRNGHGAGFWDRDYPEPQGERLTLAAEALGEKYLYAGDDGKVYIA